MSNQLTIRENQAISASPSESEFAVLLQQADMLTKTGFLPASIKSKEQALAIILTGRELGIPAMAALNTINVIQQKPTVSPQLMLALIERSGQLEDIRYNITEKQAVVTMKRVGRSPHSETFTEANAQSLGLLQKQNWKAQKTTMLKWRAVAACARVVFADVILGIYLPDEMGDENLPNSEMQSNVVVKMPPPQNFSEEVFTEAEIVETSVATDREDYEAEWNEIIGQPTAPQTPQVSSQTRGRLLAEAGHLGRSAKGYTCTETIDGESVIFDILKANGIITCTCEDYAAHSDKDANYRCAHKWALITSLEMTQKQAA